jgi:putative oxidoreductase
MTLEDQSPSWAQATDGIAKNLSDILLLLARIGIAYLYYVAVSGKLAGLEGWVANGLTKQGVPGGMAMGYLVITTEIVGSLLILFGLCTRYAALLLTLFVIIASFVGHRYWEADAPQVRNQTTHFYKNVSIIGGYLILFITGAGRYSLDHLLAKKK